MRGRLTVVAAAAHGSRPAALDAGHGRLPGLAARFVDGVRDEACRRGWRDVELAGLVAATEDRSDLWLVTPGARPWRAPEVRRWKDSRFLPSAQDLQSLILTVAANRAHRVCLAAMSGSGRRGEAALGRLHAAGAVAGRVDSGLAAALGAGWAVELLVAPIVTRDSLAGLRDAMVSAPRCAWCGVPVLGSRCTRCSAEAR